MSSTADIAFLLLIFFMVATVLKVDPDIPLTLPDRAAESLKDRDVQLSVDQQGQYWFGGKVYPRNTALLLVQAEVGEKPDVRVLVQAHKDLDFAIVQDLLDGMKDVGVKNFAMVTKQSKQ